MTIETIHTAKAAAFTELVLEVFRLNGALLAVGDELGADLGLTSARWQVMGALADKAQTVPQIARAMGLTRQGVQRTVNLLLEEGLVEQRDNPQHKRARLVDLSALGRRQFEAISARQRHWANRVAEPEKLTELQAALAVLRRLHAAVTSSDDS